MLVMALVFLAGSIIYAASAITKAITEAAERSDRVVVSHLDLVAKRLGWVEEVAKILNSFRKDFREENVARMAEELEQVKQVAAFEEAERLQREEGLTFEEAMRRVAPFEEF